MSGCTCSQLQQTVSDSEVKGNAWVQLFPVATDCHTVRSREMPGCTCAQLQQTVSHIEVRENALVHLCTDATDCVTH